MTEEQTRELPRLDYDWYLLGQSQAALQYLNQGKEGIPLARKGLELVLQDIGQKDLWILNTVTDPEVFHKALRNQFNSYQQYRAQQTVGDLTGRYTDQITKYLGESAESALEELQGFKDETYDGVAHKIDEAEDVIRGKKFNRSSNKDVEAAEKTLEKYSRIKETFDLLESIALRKFRTRVEEEATRDTLRHLYKVDESEQDE